MAELPQSVRDRLSAAQATGGAAHPDSDLLAAFAENALLAGERDRVLAHLAVCPECRLVISLAQPETVPQTVATVERKRAWFEWKVFRVAGALAAVAVVAIAVLLHRPQSERSGFDDASFAKPSSAEQGQRQMSPASVDQKPASIDQTKKEDRPGFAKQATAAKAKDNVASHRSFDRFESTRQPAPPAARADEARENDAAQRLKEVTPESRGVINMSAPAPPPPLLDKSRDNSAMPPRANAIGAVLNANRPPLQETPAPAAPTSRSEQITVEAAAEPAPIQQQKMASQVQAAPLAMRQSSQAPLQRALAAQWRITDGGLLQRFITDQDWRTISPGGQSDFRTVASAGNHVWVGGVSGLYHSADGGEHWKRVQIGSPDTKDIGEVVSIRMTNADELAVYTASSEVWVTRNGGRTWSRQQK